MITIINDSTRRSAVATALMIMSCLLLSGCVGKNGTGTVAMKKVSQSNPKENTDEQRIALCQQRVNSLKNINPQSYQKRIFSSLFPTIPFTKPSFLNAFPHIL